MTTAPALTRLNPPALPDAGAVGYSQITTVEPGRLAFISGQVAWPRDGGPTPVALSEQTKLVVQHAKAALEAVKASPHDIVMVRVYMIDLRSETKAEVMAQLVEFFEGAQPCMTDIGVAALAAPDLQIELEMVVRLPS